MLAHVVAGYSGSAPPRESTSDVAASRVFERPWLDGSSRTVGSGGPFAVDASQSEPYTSDRTTDLLFAELGGTYFF
jgi:hypothetical protein